ncbi:MAG: hypothetical protein JNM07_03780 [Phycisphaerae bacterium]|nr:hypothetical protein [Phycisphaerae bacterium]
MRAPAWIFRSLLLTLAFAARPAVASDEGARLVQTLREAVQAGPDASAANGPGTTRAEGRDEALLAGLRRLRDPALRPLFAALATGRSESQRRHGILGLAELGTSSPDPNDGGVRRGGPAAGEIPGGVDLLLVRRLPNVREQARVLSEAIGLGLIGASDLEDLARWPDIDDALAMLVQGRLRREGNAAAVDLALLRRKADAERPLIAVLANLQLAQLGLPARTPEETMRTLEMVGEADRPANLVQALRYIREERLSAVIESVRWALDAPLGSPLVRLEALGVLLSVWPGRPDARAAWAAEFRQAPDLGARTQAALVLLHAVIDAEDPAPLAEAAAEIERSGESSLVPLARAGRALISWRVSPAAAAVEAWRVPAAELLRSGNVPRIEWVLRAASAAPRDGSAASSELLHRALDTAAGAAEDTRRETFDAMTMAVARVLDARDVPALAVLGRVVAAARSDSKERTLVSLLEGLSRSHWREGARAVLRFARIDIASGEGPLGPGGARIADLVTLIYGAEPGAPAEGEPAIEAATAAQTHLGRLERIGIGLGSGDLAPWQRVQAAWEAIRARGEHAGALADLCAAVGSP